jgi:uncharacterized protein (DUF885 family)
MRTLRMFFVLLAAAVSLVAQDVHSKNVKPIAERLAEQNALFDEQYESDLNNSPERATAYGDYRYNDQLDDYSLAFIRRRHDINESFLKRIQAISTADFPGQDQLSHDLLIRVLEQRLTDYDLKEYEMPINTQGGIHTNLADLPLAVPLDSVKHYEDYVARLRQIPRALGQMTEVLRAGMKDKLMPVRFIAEKIPPNAMASSPPIPSSNLQKNTRQAFRRKIRSASPRKSPTRSTMKCCPPTKHSPSSRAMNMPLRAELSFPSCLCPTARSATTTTSTPAPPRT